MEPFHFPGQTAHYHGKVRDVYFLSNDKLVMVASDRISAFDVILPKPIPYKGQILNQIAAFMLQYTADVCPNWLEHVPAPNVSMGKKCRPFKIEMVVRGNLVGHAWRTYRDGKRSLCGANLPPGLHENDFFPAPIITPSTKADTGHDEDISKEEIISNGLATKAEYEQLENYALALFKKGAEYANSRGLILADTKYEFGLFDGKIFLMDEVHTPDSSRYFYKEHFETNQLEGKKQKQLSKEFVREWLLAHDFMGKEGQQVPEMQDEWIRTIQNRYIELYEILLGKKFIPEPVDRSIIENRVSEILREESL